jgi:hypothetical protein
MRIGKLCFGADDFQFGLELCLHKSGYKAKNADKYSAVYCDVLLVTMFWFRDIYFWEKFRRDSGLLSSEKKPVVIIGGMQATLTPKLCAEMADYVFIGDADDHLGDILDSIRDNKTPECKHLYWKGKKTIPEPAECDPIAFAIRKGNMQNTMRIEIARGCKFKCKFCTLSGLKSYREAPTHDLIDLIREKAAGGQKIFSLFAPERTVHSGYDALVEECKRLKIFNYSTDVRIENLGKVDTIARSRRAAVGLEGISHRLRKSIGKPFDNKFILKQMEKFIEDQVNVGFVTAYYIADLPGEEESDWDELYEFFTELESERFSRFLTFSPVLNPLSPKPFTELEYAEVHPFRNYPEKWLNFVRKNNDHWGFRILESPVWGPWIRILDALVYRGGPEAYQFIKRMPDKHLAKYPKGSDQLYLAKKLLKGIKSIGITEKQLFYPDKPKKNVKKKKAA